MIETRATVFSRRKFVLHMALRTGAVIAGGAMMCCSPAKKEASAAEAVAVDSCDDLGNVPEHDLELRRKFAYVVQSPVADNQCGNCNLYLPPKEGSACGGCMLFKGPVYAAGYCTYWAPKI